MPLRQRTGVSALRRNAWCGRRFPEHVVQDVWSPLWTYECRSLSQWTCLVAGQPPTIGFRDSRRVKTAEGMSCSSDRAGAALGASQDPAVRPEVGAPGRPRIQSGALVFASPSPASASCRTVHRSPRMTTSEPLIIDTEPDRTCDVCPHPWQEHDSLGVRYCTATATSALPRGCICS
ncbi:RGCVC family protein [Lentzea sp. NPDC059081]|uniref:RGCVC family protein n=1 Tax=Lentzea sp. NPDC059081 TaxID=3346719 RepID=UPI0036C39530